MTQKEVSITVDGKKIIVPPGPIDFNSLVRAAGAVPSTKSFSVNAVSPPSTINGNGSYNIVGGETLTSSH